MSKKKNVKVHNNQEEVEVVKSIFKAVRKGTQYILNKWEGQIKENLKNNKDEETKKDS